MAQKRITPGLTDETLVTTLVSRYKDIDLAFAAKPGTVFDSDGQRRGDIYKKVDTRAVIQSCQNILLTNRGEKPFDPDFGSDLRKLLFELNTTVSESQVRRMVTSSIKEYEPRVKVLDVQLYDTGAAKAVPRGAESIFYYRTTSGLNNDEHTLIITVSVQILNTGQNVEVAVNMNRLR